MNSPTPLAEADPAADYNDHLVQVLGSALRRGGQSLEVVPDLVKSVIRQGAWADRMVTALHRRKRYDDFMAFLAAEPPEGLGTTLALLERICAEDQEAMGLIHEATAKPEGRPKTTNNISGKSTRKHGTSRAYQMARLQRERPDLAAQVAAGTISSHRAGILAGFVVESFTIPKPVPRAAEALRRQYSPEELRELIAALTKEETA